MLERHLLFTYFLCHASFLQIVLGNICQSDNFSLKPVCNQYGYHMAKNMDIEILRSLTTLDEHVKRITVYCDSMSYCVQFKQIHSSISVSDVLASWMNPLSRKKVCSHIPCFHRVVKQFPCLKPIPKTVLRLVIMICGLTGYQLNVYNELRNEVGKVSLPCLSSALVLAQYASAEAHRRNKNITDISPMKIGLHHAICGSHVCPGSSCPKSCQVSAIKYACLEQRCPYQQHPIRQFFAWMMGGNADLLPSMKTSTKLCLTELPLKPHVSNEIDIPKIDNTKVHLGTAVHHHTNHMAVGICVGLVMIICVVAIIVVYNRKKLAPRFLPKRSQYVRMENS